MSNSSGRYADLQRYADLHMHTVCSDGRYTPIEVVDKAHSLGFSAISITDHDTCEGYRRAKEHAEGLGVELIPGIEISSAIGRKTVHILGYFIDINSEPIQKIIAETQVRRLSRMERMVEKLNRQGLDIAMDGVTKFTAGGTVGRANLAKYMVSLGYAKNVEDVFQRYLGDGKSAYEPVGLYTPEEVIEMIHEAGGLSSLAHPGCSKIDDKVIRLADAGLDGIEVFTPYHNQGARSRYSQIASQLKLLVTGGSDSHGDIPGRQDIGAVKLEYKYVNNLKDKAAVAATL